MRRDQPVPAQPIEDQRLGVPVEVAGRVGFDRVEIIEQFYVDGQRAIPHSP